MPKYNKKQLKNMSDKELLSLASDEDLIKLQQSKGRTKPKLSDTQLQSMSVEQLQETKRQLQSRPKSMRAGGTIKIGDVVKDMNST